MLTLFTIPKPFEGHIGAIQRNAIRSWQALNCEREIILFGDEPGVSQTSGELGVSHVPNVERNEFGTPLVNSIFNKAQDIARYGILAYVNTDIILMNGFLDAVRRISKKSFLMVGERYDLDIDEEIDFNDFSWEKQFREKINLKGVPHGKSGMDYFVFTRGLFKDIKPFAIGRTAWDNWLIYRVRSMGVPVIDATKVILAVHQNHDYSHHLLGEEGVWKGDEAKRNLALAGGVKFCFDLWDSTHILGKNSVKPALSLYHIWRRFNRGII